MEQIIFRPKLYKFDDTKSFAEAFHLGKHDLVLTTAISSTRISMATPTAHS